MATRTLTGKAAKAELPATFEQLKKILKPYAAKLRVAQDTPQWYSLETKDAVWRGRPCMFAAVRLGKGYVSYYLMSVYADKSADKQISPELKRRKQGKSCFNFTAPDAKLFAELAELTEAGAQSFVSGRFFEKLPAMKCD